MPNICDGWKATMTLLESIGILFKHKFKAVKTNSMMNCYTEEELYWMTGGNTGTLPVRITPSKINVLGENEIFVFGSNIKGMHMGGAARAAYNKFGAEWGNGMCQSTSRAEVLRYSSRMWHCWLYLKGNWPFVP